MDLWNRLDVDNSPVDILSPDVDSVIHRLQAFISYQSDGVVDIRPSANPDRPVHLGRWAQRWTLGIPCHVTAN